MKLAQRLKNPFVLGAQGFLMGGAIFWATQGDRAEAQSAIPAPAPVVAQAG